MAYRFNGTTSNIRFTAAGGQVDMGPATIAFLINMTSDPADDRCVINNPALNWVINIHGGSSNRFNYYDGGDHEHTAVPSPVSTWMISAFTKPSGTTAMRHHSFQLPSGPWAHNAGPSAGDSGVGTNAITVGSLDPDAASQYFPGDMVALGVDSSEWTDGECEARLTLNWLDWVAAGFSWLVGFETISSIVDATGGGGNETARTAISLVSDPAGWAWGATVQKVMARSFNPVPFL